MGIKSLACILLFVVTPAARSGGAHEPLCWDFDHPGHPSVRREFLTSDAVVVGRVESQASLLDREGWLSAVLSHVAVSQVFRGPPRSKMNIWSENDSGRFPLNTGVTYLFFAHWAGHGRFELDNCGNTGPLDSASAALAQVRALSRARRPPNQRLQRAGARGSGG